MYNYVSIFIHNFTYIIVIIFRSVDKLFGLFYRAKDMQQLNRTYSKYALIPENGEAIGRA